MISSQTGKDTVLLAPQAITNGASAAQTWDVKGASYATIRIPFAAELNTNGVGPTVSLLESDDTVVTNFATITADQSAIDLTESMELRYEVDLRARKRFLRLSVTPATATNDVVTCCAIGTLTRLAQGPGSASELQASTNDSVVIV